MVLEVAGVTVRFGGLTALDDVSLAVASGEAVGVIGPNGAGKTTLFNCRLRLRAAEPASVRWRGNRSRACARTRLAGLGIARTLQGVGLFAGLTALENVMVGPTGARAGTLRALLGLRGRRTSGGCGRARWTSSSA
jgi:branched-chain amino acid transport system ATP-binding protein